MAADIFAKHFINPQKWIHARKLIGVISPEMRKLVLECPAPPRKMSPVPALALVNKVCERPESNRSENPKFVCSLENQLCPIRLIRGSIVDNEVCDCCKFLNRRAPAMASRSSWSPAGGYVFTPADSTPTEENEQRSAAAAKLVAQRQRIRAARTTSVDNKSCERPASKCG